MLSKATWTLGSVFLVTMLLSIGCGPKYPNCDKDDHCAEHNQVCVDKICRECGSDQTCQEKTGDKCQVCTNYTCGRRPGCCHDDNDCPGGKCWKAEGSDIGECGGECKEDKHCPAGYKCQGERCVAPPKPTGCEATGCPAGKRCVNGGCEWACQFQTIYFDYNESRLTVDARRLLDQNVSCAKTVGVPVMIEGHCDERGTDEYNIQLGMRRANSSRKYLKDNGVSSTLDVKSWGEDHPICTESTEDCWWRNRRGEFKIQ